MAKTGWCLPQASVALYLTHLIINRRRYEIYDGVSRGSIGFAEPTFDGAAEATEVLKESLDLRVRKFDSKKRFVEETLSKTVKQILHALNKVGTGLESTEEDFEGVGLSAPRYIHGVEFMDVLKMKDTIRIKQTEVNQPWAYLTKHMPIVLFCMGLGQPIVPSWPESLCDPWRIVSPGKNYLVATGIAIRYFLEEQDEGEGGSRLENCVEWILEKSVMQSHRLGCRDLCSTYNDCVL
jgi:hypothetical protein